MKSHILVTGGAGYIGSHVVYELIDKGYTVTILDDLSLGIEENIDPRAEFILGSILSDSVLDSIFQKGIDAVIHLAASKAAGESMKNPVKYSQNNLSNCFTNSSYCRHLIESTKSHIIRATTLPQLLSIANTTSHLLFTIYIVYFRKQILL